MDRWINKLEQCKHLDENEMKQLCERVRSILIEESNIQPVSSPVTICGDIHGQFWDLLELLRKGGKVPETSYIFMVCNQRSSLHLIAHYLYRATLSIEDTIVSRPYRSCLLLKPGVVTSSLFVSY